MNIEQATLDFEQTVQRMQADLISYAGRPSSNAAAVETRKKNINSLVEYYTQSEETRSQLEMDLLDTQVNFSKLHTNTSKLVLFCKLHNIDPNLIFGFTMDELEYMHANGLRFGSPQVFKCYEKANGKIAGQLVFDPELDAKTYPFQKKYDTLLANACYAQKTNF